MSGRSEGTAEIVFARREDAVSAVNRYNNAQLDGKPLKIEIVGTNIAMSLLKNLTVPINYTKRIGQCDKIIDGEVHVGGQEHFYLEPQSSLVWTMDSGSEVHMISSTQED